MDTVAIYGRWQHIPHVMGRVDYLTSPERQERLLAVGGELDQTFWARLTVSGPGGRVAAAGRKR